MGMILTILEYDDEGAAAFSLDGTCLASVRQDDDGRSACRELALNFAKAIGAEVVVTKRDDDS